MIPRRVRASAALRRYCTRLTCLGAGYACAFNLGIGGHCVGTNSASIVSAVQTNTLPLVLRSLLASTQARQNVAQLPGAIPARDPISIIAHGISIPHVIALACSAGTPRATPRSEERRVGKEGRY